MHDARHTVLTIELKDNSSAKAFADLLKAGDVTLHLADYGGFEKVGDLPKTLPRNDVDIRTHPGDVILYLGKHICLYYATNEWRFTRLGRITNPDPQSLRQVFGPADIDVTFRLKR
ncbi:MAG TPA: hypothetical protein DCW60_01040 [Sutterella sp.]|nr:hypothetical protein [Sutterella sp.]